MQAAIDLHLPFPGRISPDLPAARERGLKWAKGNRLITNSTDERSYRSWDIAGLMARWLPDAEGAALDLGINAVVVATLLDDQFDGPLAEKPDRVANACAPLLAVIHDQDYGARTRGVPLVEAFTEVWGRICSGASPQWRARTVEHWRWYLEAYAEEAAIRARRVPQRVEQYLALRRKSGFVFAMLDLSEVAYGFETSPRVRQVPEVQRMLAIAADVIDTVNDVYSLEKEASRGDVHNLVLVLKHELRLTTEQALATAQDRVHRWCGEFLRLEQRLPLACAQHDLREDESIALRRLVAAMRDAMGGFPTWSDLSGRYSRLVPVGEAAYCAELL